jgi:hypothetical protein
VQILPIGAVLPVFRFVGGKDSTTAGRRVKLRGEKTFGAVPDCSRNFAAKAIPSLDTIKKIDKISIDLSSA